MNKIVFISNIEVKELPINLKNKYQLELKLFDINNKQTSFATSLMKQEEVVKYKSDLYKILNAHSKLQAIHNPKIKSFSLILDDKNKIAGLEFEKGIILKNEIKFLNNQKDAYK